MSRTFLNYCLNHDLHDYPFSVAVTTTKVEKNYHDIVLSFGGFYKKGNVDIVCAKHGLLEVTSLDDLIGVLNVWLS